MKITLFLMTQKGYRVLEEICKNKFGALIDKVVVGKDKNIDNDYSHEISELCVINNINYCYRNDLKEINTEYSIAVSWRWMIDCKITKLIVVHDSILPKYRGYAPLVNSLINGETRIGVTALFAAEEYDKGDIIAQSVQEISYPIKIADAIERIIYNYIEVVIKVVNLISEERQMIRTEQNEAEASYSLWRDEEDYSINWENSSEEIKRFIDAVGKPYSGASSFIGARKVRILDAEEFEDKNIENRITGKLIFISEGCPIIVCGKGLIKIKKMIFDDTGEEAVPLKNYRIRLK
ncbi:MAG: formyltransferase family protein [Candidatus Delongbacteria bacterium]|jgi:methionyl-tRNA formyltransferase|nr:formyltransferase family protein [Candidatus Delongbacteria bacterium]